MLETIRILGRTLDDLERDRIMFGNRIGAIERTGYERLPHLVAIHEQLKAVEHQAELELIRAWRRHPLAPWAKGYMGLGEKSIGRLIAEIGDPYVRADGTIRTLGQLRAFCGHGDPGYSGQIPRGATQAELFKRGNPRAKKQLWLISKALMQRMCASCAREKEIRRVELGLNPNAAVPWAPPPPDCSCLLDDLKSRTVYDAARLQYAVALHERACVRCGPAGHPALPASPLSDGHKHARALRAAGKAFLADLYDASAGVTQGLNEPHNADGGARGSDPDTNAGATQAPYEPHPPYGGVRVLTGASA